ncbi:MAG: phosphopyruvate hydratase [Bradymonadales bacterium]|jgi:enolase
MTEIIDIFAREILDSRGIPTVEVEVTLADGSFGRAAIPSGLSVGIHEAHELRDKDLKRFGGKGVQKAINNVQEIIAQEIKGIDVLEQDFIDRTMCRLDDTENKALLGANAILGVSLAVAQAAADSLELPLYRYLGGVQANSLPVPLCNIINGGVHADNHLDFQEFMIAPVGFSTYSEALRASTEVFHALKCILREANELVSIGEEGGFSPQFRETRQALDAIMQAINKVGYSPGKHFYLAVDCAANEFYCSKSKVYELKGEGLTLNKEELAEYYKRCFAGYPMIAIEDPFEQNDWTSWAAFTKSHKKVHVVGDDLFASNAKRLQTGIDRSAASAIVIAPNQVGTLSETMDSIRRASRNGISAIVSHRSGDTEDTFIADLCVAANAKMIKTGGLCRSERVAKYNQLLRIEEELGEDASYTSVFALLK